MSVILSFLNYSFGTPQACQMQWPVPNRKKITSRFGETRKDGKTHKGIDIDLENGDLVVAAYDGKVKEINYKSDYGQRIVIDHGNGIETLYAHLMEDGILVKKGQHVSKGEKIAKGDATGHVIPGKNGDGSHLHFEVRVNGQPVNPEDWLINTCKKTPNGTNTEAGKNSSIVAARDPNFMHGKQGYVTPGEVLTYTVEFENEGEGKAYGVYIVNPIDEDLDDTTLQVFGLKRIDENKKETDANFDVIYSSQTKILKVFVDNGGEVLSKCGGKFSYRIKVKDDAKPGTVITNYAVVYFPSVPEETRTNTVVSVVPYKTQIGYVGDLSVKQNSVIELKAELTTTDGKKVPYQQVVFYIQNSSYVATTDYEGVATYLTAISVPAGGYEVIVDYSGDGFYYLTSKDVKPIVVETEDIDATFKCGEVYSYPNPAKQTNPKIHIEVGLADKVEVWIYDIACNLVHYKDITDKLQVKDNKYVYEYEWDVSKVASGVYIYYIKAEKQGYKPIEIKKKLAVIK